jgi:two-component system cell cycle response regulator
MQIPFNGNMLRITASFGLASLESEKDESVMDLVGRADTYLYQAKGTGRNRVVSQIPAAT